MNNNTFKHISTILEDLLKNQGIDIKIKHHVIMTTWPQLVGDKMGRISKIERIVGKTLIIKLDNNSWRTELILQREKIIQTINDKMGEKIIDEIRFT